MADLPRIAIASPVGLGSESHTCGRYIAQLSVQLGQTGWFGGIEWPTTVQSRILDARNTLVQMARDRDCQWLLFIDPDMQPDVEVGRVPTALPFFHSSYRMLQQLKEGKIEGCPAGSLGIVGAPALSGPPDFKVNVLTSKGEAQDPEFRRITQEEAMTKTTSIERVMAIGTGLMLIPMEVFDRIKEPYFDDIYKDVAKKEVWSSQDTTFCLNCNAAGISVWCNWYSWARHWKLCPVDRPTPELLTFLRSDIGKEGEKCQSYPKDSVTKASPTADDYPGLEKLFGQPNQSSSPTIGGGRNAFPFPEPALAQ